jgi:hypothetical protein
MAAIVTAGAGIRQSLNRRAPRLLPVLLLAVVLVLPGADSEGRVVAALVSRLQLFAGTDGAEDATDGTATENDDGATWTLALDEG